MASSDPSESSSRFAALLEDLSYAVRNDPSYLIEMLNQATTIKQRRAFWTARRVATEAEKNARKACVADKAEWTCQAVSPCGTGDCHFATLDIYVESPGSKTKPREAVSPTYSLDAVIDRLKSEPGIAD